MILAGDCVERMRELPDASVDAIVTDPPYGLEFMGKEWDSIGSRAGNPFDVRGGKLTKHSKRPESPPLPTLGARYSMPRCTTCGKWQYNAHKANQCTCDSPTWERRTSLAYPHKMQAWHEQWAREAFRVAKPGAHLLAFGGTRTYHRLAAAIEDAGWEIRDTLVWAYASGFPKSLDVSKAIDKAAGHTRARVPNPRQRAATPGATYAHDEWTRENYTTRSDPTPATDDAKRWQGWGTALKPAWEPIVLARKPLVGTVAANVLRHGTGALNIDATRIAHNGDIANARGGGQGAGYEAHNHYGRKYGNNLGGIVADPNPAGRWPANVILTDPIFDGDVDGVVGGGRSESGKMMPTDVRSERDVYRADAASGYTTMETYGDSGTYSRFFLIPKADRSDREPVLRGQLEERVIETQGKAEGWTWDENGGHTTGDNRKARANVHPTVKPTELMRHLVRLVTPPGGTVLDPFLGSGTTAIACEQEGFAWIGIEKEPEYVAIAEARLNGVQRGLGLDVEAPVRKRAKSTGHWPKERTPGKDGWGFTGQTGLDERFDKPEEAA